MGCNGVRMEVVLRWSWCYDGHGDEMRKMWYGGCWKDNSDRLETL